MAKIFIATPAFRGQVTNDYAISLANTILALFKAGHESVLKIRNSGSLIALERNAMVEYFIKSDCSHMLCIDADISWQAEDLLKMIAYDKDFMSGCYPNRDVKTGFHFKAVENKDGSFVYVENLIKMLCVPAGFMLIKRLVIETLYYKFENLYYQPPTGSDLGLQCALFNTELMNGYMWGEDYMFCLRAGHAGFDIWVDPSLIFNHNGVIGSLEEHLKK